ncbi:MAG: hypothetical protein IPP94_10190 [Ignavibacteria bacterium]|nr:hypothetical protein [Ignavibacteria bacterium]
MRTLIRSCRPMLVPAFLLSCLLPLRTHAQGNIDWEELWIVMQPATQTGTYGWMAGQRQYTGVAYDKFRDVFYVVNPALVTVGSATVAMPTIRIFDPSTGLPKLSMGRHATTGAGGYLPVPLDTVVAARGWPDSTWGGYAQGQFSLYKIDVDDEGRIYACNLAAPIWGICFPGPPPNCDPTYLSQGPFRVYRWDTPTSTPRRVYATLNASANATGSLTNSEMPWRRIGDAFDVVGKRERVLDPATQQYKVVDSTRIYVSCAGDTSAGSLNDEILVLQTDTTRTVSDGLGRMLPMHLAKRMISWLSGHGGQGVAAVDATSLSDVWMARGGSMVVKGRQHRKIGTWPILDTLVIVSILPTDPITGTGPSGPLATYHIPQNGNKFLVCADGLPSNPANPTAPNYNTRARVMNVTAPMQERREPGLGDTPYLGQNSLTLNGGTNSYISDVDFKLEFDPQGYCPFVTLFLIMSNNGIASFRSRVRFFGCDPVTIRTFDAAVLSGMIRLSWEVEKESNLLGYEVQRRFAGESDYANIGFVQAEGAEGNARAYGYDDTRTPRHESAGSISYRLKQIDTDGSYEYSPTAEVRIDGGGDVRLAQNHPNPFNPTTSIAYTLPADSRVVLTLVNSLGSTVRVLVDAAQSAGAHSVTLDASSLPSGTYTYQLVACGRVLVRSLTVVR